MYDITKWTGLRVASAVKARRLAVLHRDQAAALVGEVAAGMRNHLIDDGFGEFEGHSRSVRRGGDWDKGDLYPVSRLKPGAHIDRQGNELLYAFGWKRLPRSQSQMTGLLRLAFKDAFGIG